MCISAEGAGYKSQGQVRSEAEHVAPGNETKNGVPALKGRNYFGLSGLKIVFWGFNQGRRASRLPLAIIFRAFGAVGAEISSHKRLY